VLLPLIIFKNECELISVGLLPGQWDSVIIPTFKIIYSSYYPYYGILQRLNCLDFDWPRRVNFCPDHFRGFVIFCKQREKNNLPSRY
jgi:hypothetical protein